MVPWRDIPRGVGFGLGDCGENFFGKVEDVIVLIASSLMTQHAIVRTRNRTFFRTGGFVCFRPKADISVSCMAARTSQKQLATVV